MPSPETAAILKSIAPDIDACRVNHYGELIEFIAQYDMSRFRSMAEFGEASNGIMKAIVERTASLEYTHLPYPEYDLMNLKTIDTQYDILLLDQILEHVKNPFRVAEQLKNYLAPNGLIVATAAFLYPVHFNKVDDYFRFTNSGLREVFKDYTLLLVKQFGNQDFVSYLASHHWFEDGHDGGYAANTVDKASALGLLERNNEEFGVTNIVIARNA